MAEPKLELDAILDNPEQHPNFEVLSVARYALLDLVDSPFLGKQPFNLASVIPSWYIMTSNIKDIRGFNSKNIDELKARAVEKADTITDMGLLTRFTKAFLAYLDEMNKIAPDATEDDKSKKAESARPTDS